MSRGEEIEVFRITENVFEENKSKNIEYAYTLYTRREGSYTKNNEKYFTTNPLQYVGKYKYSVINGFGDGSSMYSIFEKEDGTSIKIDYDYEGRTCFLPLTKN